MTKNMNPTITKRLFYRVGTESTEGLWYNKNGVHVGLIHNELNFCAAKDLAMPFDESIVGWLSVAESLENLYEWFPKEDIFELQKRGFFIYEYQAMDWKWYEPFAHNVINQKTSVITNKLLMV